MKLQLSLRHWLPLVIILLIAMAFRVYAIDRLPPGLFGDEAVEGLDALDILAGNWQIWFHAHLGREPLFVYLVAISYALFGVSAMATRVPALVAGILTIPVAYWLAREWSHAILPPDRARRVALLTAALVAISFWHIQMTRDAHRDILLPLVEAIGYALLWRALGKFENGDWRLYPLAGAILGLAIYTYSPGRFVGVFIAIFFVLELIFMSFARFVPFAHMRFDWRGLVLAAACAILVMLPLGIYFVQNPAQFTRRFDSTSILNAPEPLAALTESAIGNLAMFVVPGSGYQSRHYNLPGKPVFDLLLAPWFLFGLAIAFARLRHPQYRFLLLWFLVMLIPAFLTADMIPKGVRDLGVVPGVFIFPALALEEAYSKVRRPESRVQSRQIIVAGLIAISIAGSALWTAYDYFVAWANLPELPTAFDQDYADVSKFIRAQPVNQPIYVSAEVYRHPTFMLLGKQVPTSRYFDRADRIREFDARAAFVVDARDVNAAYVFVGDYAPSEAWLARITASAAPIENHSNFSVLRGARLAPPQQTTDRSFNPLLKLVGYSRFAGESRGIALYWQVIALPADRADMQSRVSFFDARSQLITQSTHRLGAPPMEWNTGDTIVDWYEIDVPDTAAQFLIQLQRGAEKWEVIGNW